LNIFKFFKFLNFFLIFLIFFGFWFLIFGCRYLHHYATPHIIHRDVKASNVLLDENFEAQVADFGFAKLIPDGATHVTTGVKGTLGYLAPEYAMWGKVSESCDVYSFGILVLELISGKKPIDRVGHAKRTIVEWAGPFVLQGRYRDLVDPKLQGKFDQDELIRLVQVMLIIYFFHNNPSCIIFIFNLFF
jgi:serine/threonine protein kinase